MVILMKCLNDKCDATDIEKDDNFCYKCGQWTTVGYTFLKDEENIDKISSGTVFKQKGRLIVLGSLLAISFIAFFVMLAVRGNDLFKPFFYIKKQMLNYKYGYNTTLLKTDNKYSGKTVKNYEDAISLIKKDFSDQEVFCFNKDEVNILVDILEEEYEIPSISFCDMNVKEATNIKNVLDNMYLLFPGVKGALTNITITNADKSDKYVARFQPMYQFVNINENIKKYNKVNKTQILLNSYYFLNENTLNKSVESVVGDNWYVKDATWESTIAHEFGHYISFYTLLKKNNIDNITFINNENYYLVDDIIKEFNSGSYSLGIVNEALNNYNNKYDKNLSLDEFASSISKYAGSKDKNGNLIADETIAEAIHDYYLHGDNMNLCSKEILSIINAKL